MEEYVRPAPPPCELDPWLAVSYCCDVGDDTDVGGPEVADSYLGWAKPSNFRIPYSFKCEDQYKHDEIGGPSAQFHNSVVFRYRFLRIPVLVRPPRRGQNASQ